MKIDLHVHTAERSACGRAPGADQVRAAIAAGLDAIILTDHRRLAPAADLAAWNEAHAPFRVFGGIELTVEGEDLLVLGLDDPCLETREKWSYPDLHELAREKGAFLALAHPFRYHPEIALDLARRPVDAIEVYSRNTPPAAAGRIFRLAAALGVPVLSNSDAHETAPLGTFYNRLDRTPADERELLDLLRRGRFSGIHRCPDGSTRETARGHLPCADTAPAP